MKGLQGVSEFQYRFCWDKIVIDQMAPVIWTLENPLSAAATSFLNKRSLLFRPCCCMDPPCLKEDAGSMTMASVNLWHGGRAFQVTFMGFTTGCWMWLGETLSPGPFSPVSVWISFEAGFSREASLSDVFPTTSLFTPHQVSFNSSALPSHRTLALCRIKLYWNSIVVWDFLMWGMFVTGLLGCVPSLRPFTVTVRVEHAVKTTNKASITTSPARNSPMILSNKLSGNEKSSVESQPCVSLLSMTNGALLEITRKKDLDKQVYATNICNPSCWLSALIACQLYLKRLCEAQSCPLMMSERGMQETNRSLWKVWSQLGEIC